MGRWRVLVSRSPLARLCSLGMLRGGMDPGSLTCSGCHHTQQGEGRVAERPASVCQRERPLWGPRGAAIGFGARWGVRCLPSRRSEAGQRHSALLAREKELIERWSFSEASSCSVWRVRSGWSRGGVDRSGAVSLQDGEQLAWEEAAGTETERDHCVLPPSPPIPSAPHSEDTDTP